MEDVCQVEIPLRGAYGGNNAIHRLDQADRALVEARTEGVQRVEDQTAITSADTTPAGGDRASAGSSSQEFAPTSERKRIFDGYMMVDWSSSSTPCWGRNSIWIGCGEWAGDTLFETWRNPHTRHQAFTAMAETLARWCAEGKRCLVGLDFAFGYPAGFAAALRLADPPWKAILNHVAQGITDTAQNHHNRDAFAAACNATISSGPGPFWGCHGGAMCTTLTTRRVGLFTFPQAGMEEYRTTERRANQITTIQSVWKLNQGVSVGGQTLLGLKYLHQLRNDPTRSVATQIWPFETGWGVGDARVVLAEIFPSVVPLDGTLSGVSDLIQVRSCVRHAAKEDSLGALGARFLRPVGLTSTEEVLIRGEEGWILFV